MTGVLNAIVGVNSNSRHAVTIGFSGVGGDPVGYSIPSALNIGSCSPATLRGTTIQSVYSRPNRDLEFWLVGGFAQAHFYSITIEAGDGTQRTYTTASASLYQNQAGTLTVWGWGTGSNRVWQEADNTEQHWFSIRF